jgi:hypothetical protein
VPAKPVNLDFESQRAPSVATQLRQVAKGWASLAVSTPGSEIGLDGNIRHGGNRSLFIKSKVPHPSGVPTRIRQEFRADDYRGKRLRLSGYVKSENVDQSACLWMRLDCERQSVLDYMRDRPITGTRDWRIYDIVLDVPEDAVNIGFGVALAGKGQAWFDDLQFEIVGRDVLTTTPPIEIRRAARKIEPASQAKPINLDFEE